MPLKKAMAPSDTNGAIERFFAYDPLTVCAKEEKAAQPVRVETPTREDTWAVLSKRQEVGANVVRNFFWQMMSDLQLAQIIQ